MAEVICAARIQFYDPDTQTLCLCIDDTNVSGFWVELNLDILKLNEWIEFIGKETTEEKETEETKCKE